MSVLKLRLGKEKKFGCWSFRNLRKRIIDGLIAFECTVHARNCGKAKNYSARSVKFPMSAGITRHILPELSLVPREGSESLTLGFYIAISILSLVVPRARHTLIFCQLVNQ